MISSKFDKSVTIFRRGYLITFEKVFLSISDNVKMCTKISYSERLHFWCKRLAHLGNGSRVWGVETYGMWCITIDVNQYHSTAFVRLALMC